MAKLGREVRATLADGRALCVRDARTRDARPLVRLLDAVAAEPASGLLLVPGQYGPADWRRRIADTLSDPGSIFLMADVDGVLAGNLGLRRDSHPSSRHVMTLGMSVAAPFRDAGVGGILLETAVSWAAERGIIRVALGVFPENAAAIRFYERHGFAREGVRRAQYDRAGVYHDEVLMARLLASIP